jgi:hypothetical protein
VRRVLAALVLALCPATAAGAALILDARAQQEAIRAGERSVSDDAFDAEWRVRNAAGETVTVLTPFHRLVVASRHAAFDGKPLKPSEPPRVLRAARDRLVFMVRLRGGAEGFARFYAPKLVVGDREIKPAFVQNERTAARQDDGRYAASSVYGFPTRDLDPRAVATLIVTDGNGKEVSRFAVDLAKMR